jgi:signal transduction histidine kinase
VWTVNPSCDTVSSLASFLEQQVEHFLRSDQVRMNLDFPDEIPDLPLGSAARYQIALVVREALTNVVRHSGATEMTLRLRFPDSKNGHGVIRSTEMDTRFVRVEVQDNGRGLSNENRLGNGLRNMRSRVEKIGGQLEFQSPEAGGTVVVLTVPVTSNTK